MDYLDFYRELIREGVSLRFASDKQFSDEQKRDAKVALTQYIKNGYKYYREKFGELAIGRYDFILKDIRDHWSEVKYRFDVVGRGGRDTGELAFPGTDVESLKLLKRDYRKYRDVKDAVEDIPVNGDSAYRGMSFEELLDAKKKGHFKSSGIMNIGDSQDNYTFFGDNPTTARYYSVGFQPMPSSVTRNRPGVIIEVPRSILLPAHTTMSKKTNRPVGTDNEFVTDDIINFSDVKNLWLIIPERSGFGMFEVVYDKWNKVYREGSRSAASLNYKLVHKKGMI